MYCKCTKTSFHSLIEQQNECLLASNGNRTLPVFERQEDDENQFEDNPIQAIITSYRFNCCGVITGWGAFMEKPRSDFNYQISFQVWRPNSLSTNCYNLTGNNQFDVELQRLARSNPMRGLINVTTPLNERITVQPGDVVGFNFRSKRDNDDGILSRDPYHDESVWFRLTDDESETGQTACPADRFSSTNLAPVITATVGKALTCIY